MVFYGLPYYSISEIEPRNFAGPMHENMKTVSGRYVEEAMPVVASTVVSERRSLNWWLLLGDAFGLIVSWLLALGLLWSFEDEAWREGIVQWWSALGDRRILLLVGLLMAALVTFWLRGHYSKRRPVSSEVLDIAKVFLAIAVLDAFVSYLGKWNFSRSWFLTAWLLAFMFVPLVRVVTKRILIRSGRWLRPTVIVGIGRNAREAAEALNSEPLMGLEVSAFLALPTDEMCESFLDVAGKHVPIIALGSEPFPILDRLGSPQVVVALEAENLLPYQKLLQKLSARFTDTCIIPPLRGLPLYGMEMTHFFSHEVLMLTMRNNLARPGPRFVKRSFDIVASSALIIFLAPMFAFFSWKIRRTDGAAIFGHERVGRDGKAFRCLKFRTMVSNADKVLEELLARDPEAQAEWNRDFKLKNDPRVTAIGRFLRETSLDELPQLWNVIKGEMSLVGPRPVVVDELARYGDQAGYYLETRPGMTGLWQVSGRNNTGYDDRVALDCWYVRNWSLWHDMVILLRTIRVVLAREGAY